MTASPDWTRGNLEFAILKILSVGPSYGYQLQKDLIQTAEQFDALELTTLYRSLRRLEAGKYIRGRWDRSTVPARKWYELTKAGQRRCERQAGAWLEQARFILRLLRAKPQSLDLPATDEA